MLECAICHTYQHGACYRILFEPNIPEKHVCALCSNEDEKRVCTDRKLAKHFKNSSPKAISATCLFRRTLAYLLTVETVSIPYLQESLGVDIEYAEGIMEKLKEEKIVEDSVYEEYIVSKEVLQLSALPKFLGIKRFKQMSFTKALKTALGMSFISMISMEVAMNLMDVWLTGGAKLTPWVVPLMLLAGFVTPLPYNYWRLKKWGLGCCG